MSARRRALRRLFVALVAIAALLVTAEPLTNATTCKRPGCRDRGGAVLWGAQIGRHLTGGEAPYDMRAADKFERRVRKRMSLLQFSLPFAHCHRLPCRFLPFPTRQMRRIRARGYVPVFGWASYAQPLSSTQGSFQLGDVIAGAHDDFIRSWARGARRWGHPFFLRFDWEMNVCGLWPYSECRNGNRPGDFVRAWRHVHALVRGEGATNATWVWCPNVEYPGSITPLRSLYPGDRYVDWTCLDGYNWGVTRVGPGWTTFHRLFSASYRAIRRLAPGKPVMIAETASTEAGGSKAAWIKDMLARQLPRNFPRVRALLWFEKEDPPGLDWPLGSSRAATSAFAAGIGAGYYAGNWFGSTDRSPIRPPRRRLVRRR